MSSRSGVETKRYVSPSCSVDPGLAGRQRRARLERSPTSRASVPGRRSRGRRSSSGAAEPARRSASASSSGTPTTTLPERGPSSSLTSTTLLAGQTSFPASSLPAAMSADVSLVVGDPLRPPARPSPPARAGPRVDAAIRSAFTLASSSASRNSSRPTRRLAARRVSTVSRSWLSAISPATHVATMTTAAARSSAQSTDASRPRAARGAILASVAVAPPSRKSRTWLRGHSSRSAEG